MTSFTHCALRVAPALIALGAAFSAFNNAYTPPFRGQVGTEFTGWETFTDAFPGPNMPDDPGTTSDTALLFQTTPGGILTSTGNIYNPAGASHFMIVDSVPEDLQQLVLQVSTAGTPLDYSSFTLSYFDGNGTQISLPPTTSSNLWASGGTVEDMFDWDLSAVSDVITAYALEFDALGAHLSLDAVLLDTRFDSDFGTNYCTAIPNSTGLAAQIEAQGSAVASDNNLSLSVTQLPLNQFGYALTSQTQGLVIAPPGSMGNLCLGGTIGRFVKQVQSSGSAGTFAFNVDLTNMPFTPAVSVMAGDTWNFTAWYRDKFAGATTSNFSDAISITFL